MQIPINNPKMRTAVIILMAMLASSSLAYISNCRRYALFSLQERCEECYEGYAPSASGYSCVSCHYSCRTCYGAYSNNCNSCKAAYFMESQGTCTTCINGCSACSDRYTCNSCSSGYFPTPDRRCGSCISNCASCTDAVTCLSCSTTFEKVTLANGYNECKATAATFIMYFFIGLAILCLIPCIICCYCWASIARCFGWAEATSIVMENGYDSYSQPPEPSFPPPPNSQGVYQPSFPAPPPGHYNNRGY